MFLKLHGEEVTAAGVGEVGESVGDGEVSGKSEESNTTLREALREWRETQEKEGKRIGELVGWCSGVVGFLRAPRG